MATRSLAALALACALAIAGAIDRAPGQDAAPTASDAAGPASPTAMVLGVRVVAPPPPELASGMRTFNAMPGTAVAIGLRSPGGGIVAIDRRSSVVDAFDDDGGRDLLLGSARSGGASGPIGMMPRISDDGTTLAFEVSAPRVPSANATRLRVRGTLAIDVATTRATREAIDVALAADTSIEVEGLSTTIASVGAPAWGDAAMTVTFRFARRVPDLVGVRFLDAEGEEIPSTPGGSSWTAFGDSTTVDRSFDLERAVERATLVFDVWTDLRRVSVPFDVVTGIGLRPTDDGATDRGSER